MLGGGELGCPDSSSRTQIGGWFIGWYLFALDARMPANAGCAGTAYLANADLPVWKLGPTIERSSMLGRIVGPRGPIVRILRDAVLRRKILLVALLDCVTPCHVALTVEDASVGITRRLTVTGHALIGLHPGPLKHGGLTVTMHVDDSPLLQGRSRYR